MGERTGISWTDHTFNPWWGCIRVSPGCEHCYAETFSNRIGLSIWGPAKTTERRLFGEKHWNEPLRWNRKAAEAGERRRVFCASMADVFEDHPQLPPERERLFRLIEVTPWLDWQLLTKRPENVMAMVPERWRAAFPPNVWIGTSTEDQQRADERVPVLLRIPAAVRFLSVEPQIGPVELTYNRFCRRMGWGPPALRSGPDPDRHLRQQVRWLLGPPSQHLRRINWVIIGGESGAGARPFDLAWAESLVQQCRASEVAVFVKQLGSRPIRDGKPFPISDFKGEVLADWPAELRVQEFPATPFTAEVAGAS